MSENIISRITTDEDGRYTWDVSTPDDDYGYRAGSYRTNQRGQGLWYWCPTPSQWYSDGTPVYEWRQIVGTCQFSLHQSSASGRRAAVRKYFTDPE